AQLNQQLAQRRAGMMGQLQPQLDAMRAADNGVSTRAIAPMKGTAVLANPAARVPMTMQPPSAPQGPVSSSSQAINAAGPNGNIQSVVPNPVIASLSVTQALPGDPVLITGSGFGTAKGTVHFVMGPGRDFTADPTTTDWRDSQVFVTVPVLRSDQP